MNKLYITHPHLESEWDFSKNTFDFKSVSTGSQKKVWWICKNQHSYQSRIDSRTGKNSGCRYCNSNKKDDPISITNPELLKFWDYDKNEADPNRLTSGSHLRAWWKCDKNHSWQSTIINKSKGKNTCPYCTNKKTSIENNLNNFPDVAIELHPFKNDELTADNVNSFSYAKIWWLGKCGHEWFSSPRIRTRKNRPTGCPVCQNSRGEVRIKKFLDSLEISYEEQKRFLDCRDKRSLPFDFFIPDLKVLIEFNGIQHYEETDFGMGELKKKEFFEGIQRRDQIKIAWALENNYNLIVVSYVDIDKIESILSQYLTKN